MIRFACPCGKQLQVRDELAGQRVACPACKHVSVVPVSSAPGPLEEVQPASAPRTAAAPVRRRPTIGSEEGESFGEGPRYAGPAERSGKATAALVLGLVSILCNVFTGLPAVLFGLLALLDIRRSNGRLEGKGFAVTGMILGVLWSVVCTSGITWLVIKARSGFGEGIGMVESIGKMTQISAALQTHAKTNNQLPPAAICDPTGKPLLSWRVTILPQLGEENLYRQFRLNEPWDSPHNKALLPRMPTVYKMPEKYAIPANETVFQAFVGNGAAFELNRGVPWPDDFKDGTSNTILVAESSRSVPWTKPEDMPFGPGPLPTLGGHLSAGTLVSLADGSVRFLKEPISDGSLRPLITRSGNDTVDWTKVQQ